MPTRSDILKTLLANIAKTKEMLDKAIEHQDYTEALALTLIMRRQLDILIENIPPNKE